MLQQEFEARVKVQVSYKEYESINEVYNNSDLDKDEFCKMWVRMNSERVNRAIAEEKERQRLAALKDKAWDIIILHRYNYKALQQPASSVLSIRQRAFCESVGVKIKDVESNPYLSTTLATVIFRLQKFVRTNNSLVLSEKVS